MFSNLSAYTISFLTFLFTQCYVASEKYQLKKHSNVLEGKSAIKWSNLNGHLALLVFLILALMLFLSPDNQDFYLTGCLLSCLFIFVVPFNIILKNENLKVLAHKPMIQALTPIFNLMNLLKQLLVRPRNSKIIPI
jgi:hypothetical protein